MRRRGQVPPAHLERLPWPEREPTPDPEIEVEADAPAAYEFVGAIEASDRSAGSDVEHVRQIDVDDADLEVLISMGAFDHDHERGFEVLRDERGRIAEIRFLEEASV